MTQTTSEALDNARRAIERFRAVLAYALSPDTFDRAVRIDMLWSRLDALGLTDEQKNVAAEQMVKFAQVAGVRGADELFDVFVTIAQSGRMGGGALMRMQRAGVTIHITPETLAACEREARES